MSSLIRRVPLLGCPALAVCMLSNEHSDNEAIYPALLDLLACCAQIPDRGVDVKSLSPEHLAAHQKAGEQELFHLETAVKEWFVI